MDREVDISGLWRAFGSALALQDNYLREGDFKGKGVQTFIHFHYGCNREKAVGHRGGIHTADEYRPCPTND